MLDPDLPLKHRFRLCSVGQLTGVRHISLNISNERFAVTRTNGLVEVWSFMKEIRSNTVFLYSLRSIRSEYQAHFCLWRSDSNLVACTLDGVCIEVDVNLDKKVNLFTLLQKFFFLCFLATSFAFWFNTL
ncbi:hypothetical protein ACOME3_003058 [Neoechinorhynchus agilis]